MTTLVYDGSFEGLLTAVFEVFEYKFVSPEIISQEKHERKNMFAEIHEVLTDPIKAERVLKKLEINLGKSGISQLLKVFLSESQNLEFLIFNAIEKSLKTPQVDILKKFW